MPNVTFLVSGGEKILVENATGTLMEAATEHQIPGIIGACGGVCSCATCHVRVAPEWLDRVGPPNAAERELLDFQANVDERSRLSCQIELRDELNGLVVEVAES